MTSEVTPEALQLRKPADEHLAETWNSANVVSQRVQLVQQVYRSIMLKDTHYGVIPGCGNKPTLLKAGSEQLLMTFKLAVRPEVIDLSTSDCARYRVLTHITHAPTGTYLGTGIGECSSDELKYKWREAVCKEEYEETPADRRRVKWVNGQRGAYSKTQVRQEVADVANTVLKMAKKRSQIDGTLTVTAASDIFTQDIEDMEHPVEADDATGTTPVATAMPQRKSQVTPIAASERSQPQAEPAPPARSPEPTHATSTANPCPDCGDPLFADGCHFCGWVPEGPQLLQPESKPAPRPAAVQQTRQPNPAAKPPEQRQSGAPKISDAQARRFFGIAMGNGITKEEQRNYLKSKHGLDSDRDITKDIYEECCAWAQGGGQ